MKIEKITVFGTGNFGARIAFHIAFNNVDVTVYDMDYGLLEEARTKFREYAEHYRKHFNASEKEIEAALANIAYSINIEEAAGNAHLILEAVTEDLEVKRKFYEELKKTAPKNAIFATTSAGLDLDVLAEISGRPEKFMNFHFTGDENKRNSAEIIILPSTEPASVKDIKDFAEKIDLKVTVNKLSPK